MPHSARIWNYWLGGKDSYPVDRLASDLYRQVFPGIVDVARASRYFLARTVRYLAGEAGIRQFLDVGTGLPAMDNTHEVAQRVAPDARVVYVDNDPLVLVYARAMLTSSRQGRCDYIEADLREPDVILAAAAAMLDFSQPIALMLMGIMGHIPDPEAQLVVRRVVADLPPGSYLGLYDGANVNEQFNNAQRGYNESGAVPYHLRSPDQIARFFDGLEIVEPGVVQTARWWPDPSPCDVPGGTCTYGGVGRKPHP